MLGTIGGKERLKCGVIGDPVNLAARIEGMSKMYGAALLISENTYAKLNDPSEYQIREVDRVATLGDGRHRSAIVRARPRLVARAFPTVAHERALRARRCAR